ncbi:methyltransferase domain-containing protein [Dyadobacter sp. CY261]|uniref:methyltransferase domain-containing protein n=1 Tax=Dyadobacter sp. CY261 TaxID=2907203 RepID=UPI001F425B59|nr:methyltransferase domain-containing protein [Dyadobacter sp. CY261]MCF0074449.1 methyltransferase domain-containing protein [Dyadobacter sp. CY261]
MPWNPEVYNQYKSERAAPALDLLALLNVRPGLTAVDLGCGTGDLTAKLAATLPDARVLGVDSSAEMLVKSSETGSSSVNFECISIEDQLKKSQQWDVVFSNAALQWVPDHETLLPRIISTLKPGGQLLIQMPPQHHNLTNRLLNELATKEPYSELYADWNRISPVLETGRYAEILFECGSQSMQVFEKIYPLVLKDVDSLLTWVSGTAIIPYLERLPDPLKEPFIKDYRALLASHFPKTPVFYAFKRILIEARF